MIVLGSEPEHLRAMGHAAQRFVRENYSIEQIANQLVTMYEEAVRGPQEQQSRTQQESGETMTARSTTWQQRYRRRYYEARPGWKDGTEEFHEMCGKAIARSSRILEIGAGPSNPTSRFLATLGELHGVDVDPAVRENTALSRAALLEGTRLPYPDTEFDACVSNYVIEHIQDPHTHMREVSRVLRPGGAYIFRTPNRLHYVSLAARLTPHWFHLLVANRLRGQPTEMHDPYPTVYQCNSQAAVRRFAASAGFEVAELRMVEKEPSYGMASRTLFFMFMTYERIVNATALAESLRANIFAVLRKT
jgi:SAM-dependent methyltransferase